jgi:DNA-binding winged helix-turn-helix (wHTH) protein
MAVIDPLRFDDFVLDRSTRELRRGGAVVHLTPKAFDLLRILLERRPQALSKAELLKATWPGTYVSEHRLATLIAEIRQAIHQHDRPPLVRTVHGFGYSFAAPSPSGSRPASGHYVLLYQRQAHPLAPGINVIGRDAGVAVRLDTPTTSRRHAEITVADHEVTVTDLGSKNGTFVGASRVDAMPQAVRVGDKLRIGSCVLTLARLGSAATETAR